MIETQPASVRRSSIRFGPAEISLDAAFFGKDGAGLNAGLTADGNGVYGTAQLGGLPDGVPCGKYNCAAGIGCVVVFKLTGTGFIPRQEPGRASVLSLERVQLNLDPAPNCRI